MFTSTLYEEVRALEEDIEAVKDKVEDPIICEKIRQFVYAPREIQAVYKADAGVYKTAIIHISRPHLLGFCRGREGAHFHRDSPLWREPPLVTRTDASCSEGTPRPR